MKGRWRAFELKQKREVHSEISHIRRSVNNNNRSSSNSTTTEATAAAAESNDNNHNELIERRRRRRLNRADTYKEYWKEPDWAGPRVPLLGSWWWELLQECWWAPQWVNP